MELGTQAELFSNWDKNGTKDSRALGRLKDAVFNFLNILWKVGVADGARTHDNWNHNPGLYQLSYMNHALKSYGYLNFSQ